MAEPQQDEWKEGDPVSRIRRSMAGDLPIVVPARKGLRRLTPSPSAAPDWGWLAWLAIAVGAAGLLAWWLATVHRG